MMNEPVLLPSILIIDDEPGLGDLIRRTLLRSGFEAVEVALSARRGLEILRSRRADLVIVDVTLRPDDQFRNGFAAGTEISKRYPAIRLIYISGYTLSDVRADDAAISFLQKPFKPHELREKIAEVMKQPPPKGRRSNAGDR